MKFSTRKKWAAAPAILAFGLFFSFSSMAAVDGRLESEDSSAITGWAWDSDDTERFIDVTIEVTPADSKTAVRTLNATADHYRADLSSLIGDGWHSFSCDIDWSDLSGDKFTVTAYAVSDGEKIPLSGSITYDRSDGSAAPASDSDTAPASNSDASTSSDGDTTPASDDTVAASSDSDMAPASDGGPGSSGPSEQAGPADSDEAQAGSWKKGDSLGMFTTTGYCNCALCSGGSGLTYSGTVPRARHTIAADLNVLPIGTKVMIDGIVYTVEDMGSGVSGQTIDIYYDNHSEAVAHGTRQQEVFMVSAE